MVRVTFGGDDLASFQWSGPASHVKLIFDATGEAAAGSSAGASGTETARPIMRTYTPRRFDPETRELDVDLVIHGEGPASAWADQAAPGQTLTVSGPGRSYAIDPTADWYVLAGDDTAIPAICTILQSLPATVKALVLLEVVDGAEEHPLEARSANTEIRWLRRGPRAANAGHELEAALRRIELPAGSGRIYVACESDAMRRIRRHLLHERQFPRAQLVTRGYWRLGETDHPDRDYGEDVE
jgi:NADPH-dependent ferric siderophore reductase